MRALKARAAEFWPLSDALRARQVNHLLHQVSSYDAPIRARIDEYRTSGKSALVGRLGATEARVLGAWLGRRQSSQFGSLDRSLWFGPYGRRAQQLKTNAGVYPVNRMSVDSFCELYLGLLQGIDVMGVWGKAFTWPESLTFSNPNVQATHIEAVAPWIRAWDDVLRQENGHKPWSHALEGLRVLVISPFADSIKRQHHRIDLVFPSEVFPVFDLQVLKSTQSIGGLNDGRSWSLHLARMQEQMASLDFDVALVGAGAYSLPLAAHARDLGRVGIHAGGGLQLFFGIIGTRWASNPNVSPFVNEYWTRPRKEERPNTWQQVEGGCYW